MANLLSKPKAAPRHLQEFILYLLESPEAYGRADDEIALRIADGTAVLKTTGERTLVDFYPTDGERWRFTVPRKRLRRLGEILRRRKDRRTGYDKVLFWRGA